MSLFERLSNTFKFSTEQLPKEEEEEALPVNAPSPPVNSYYVDTMAKATTEEGQKAADVPVVAPAPPTTPAAPAAPQGKVEAEYEKTSRAMNEQLANNMINYARMQELVYKVIMMMNRLAAKADMDQIQEFSIKIKKQAYEIQGTYNTWQGLTITLISAGVSVAGGIAGVSPILPFVFKPETAKWLIHSSQAIGTAGTGLNSIASVFDKRSEGQRTVMQTFQRIFQDKEEERKSGKQNKNELIKTARSGLEEALRQDHQSKSGILN